MEYNSLEMLDLRGKTVFVRLDLNVPIDGDGRIADSTRIDRSLPTLKYILERTHRVVIASHFGRPTAETRSEFSLEPIGAYLASALGIEIALTRDYGAYPVDQFLQQLGKNRLILLENLRFYAEEGKNTRNFAEKLAKGIDYYINDAFGVMHREHASVVALAEQFPCERKAIGFLVKEELNALRHLQDSSLAPYTVIIGGAKVKDKLGVILNLIRRCNTIVIGGAMAYGFLKTQGIAVGNSKIEPGSERAIATILENASKRKVAIELPVDHICATSLSASKPQEIVGPIPNALSAYDIGPKTVANIRARVESSKTVFWNGPLGVFEKQAFRGGTLAVAHSLAAASCYSVVGGGDSVAAINLAGVQDSIDHVSTGGGASLEFIEGKTLPGLKALCI